MSKKSKTTKTTKVAIVEDEYSSDYSGGSEYDPDSDFETEIQSGGEVDDDNEHLDRDLDDEGESEDGPGGVDTDGEFDPVEHEELEDDDDLGEEDEYDDVGGDDGDDVDYVSGKKSRCHLKEFDETSVIADDDSYIFSKLEYRKVPDDERQTDPVMTFYELVRVLGTRAQQFNLSAKPLVKGLENMTPARMAYVELLEKKNVFIIRRNLPGKLYEDWRTDELEIIHEINDDFFIPEGFDIKKYYK